MKNTIPHYKNQKPTHKNSLKKMSTEIIVAHGNAFGALITDYLPPICFNLSSC